LDTTLRQHGPAALVALSVFAAAIADGGFDPIAYAAASIVIWVAVVAGLLSRALPAAPVAAPAAAAGLCLAAIVVLAAASVGWAGDQGRAFEESVRASTYLGLFTLAACTASGNGRGQWIGGLAAGLGAVSVLALLSHLQPGLLENGELAGLIPDATGRLSYPIDYWNGLAALIAVATVLLAYGGAHGGARSLRVIAIATIPLAGLAIWLTSSRGGAAATLLGLAILVAASADRPRQLRAIAIAGIGAVVLIVCAEQLDSLSAAAVDDARRADGDRMSAIALAVAVATGGLAWWQDGRAAPAGPGRRVAIGLAILALGALLVGAVAADPDQRFEEFKAPPPGLQAAGETPSDEDVSSSGRWQFWGEAVDAFGSAPVAGIGAGAYEDWWAGNAPIAVFVRNPHSLPLHQLAELGLIGGGLLVGFLAAIAVAARRRLTAGLEGDGGLLIAVIVTAAAIATVDWTWQIPAAFAPAVIAAGLLSAAAPGRPLGRHAHWLGLGTLAVGWICIVAGALVVLTELKLEQSRDAAAEGRIADGLERAREARTVQPWSPEPYTQLALLEEARGDVDEALTRLEQARERDSEDWRLAVIEARLQEERGDAAAAQRALERARALNPNLPFLGGG
jgi:hypothetical protein